MNFCVSAGVLLGVVLVVEIIKELREFGEVGASARGVVGAALALALSLFVALLIHQVGELHEHFERRRAAGGDWRGRQ
jgi:hypothetical protein